MPRPLRLEYENAWYHIMNRGLNKQDIFINVSHYEIFLALLQEISVRFFIEIHSYCLMSNHYHLLLRTPLANLSRAMRHLDGVYTQRFNRLEGRDGPLFRGRYKSIVVDADTYLRQLSRYIHLNPVEAGLCTNPYDYPWSSLQFFRNSDIHPWLKKYMILNETNSEVAYKGFVEEGIDKNIETFYKKKKASPILGTKQFIETKLSEIRKSYEEPYSPDIRLAKQNYTIEEISSVVANYFKIDESIIKMKTPAITNIPKIITIFIASQFSHLTHVKIAKFLNFKSSSVGAIIKKARAIINQDVEFATHLEKIINLIK